MLIPAIYPFSWKKQDEAGLAGQNHGVAGRLTMARTLPVGQKTLLVDGEEFPFLEVRSLTFFHATNGAESDA